MVSEERVHRGGEQIKVKVERIPRVVERIKVEMERISLVYDRIWVREERNLRGAIEYDGERSESQGW
ncbi:hypothetical protein SAMN05216225_106713 [Ornithinibacillus halophilus]|uniref:Uncharacterized protein n=1 Tax=Ornithinibacillus halophilus TaxID=930117 RepID=A0A1M5MXP9_9BACI|nr:hypothetical protein SAMN05216225_106713 [Ornithinibacillus halophilus]